MAERPPRSLRETREPVEEHVAGGGRDTMPRLREGKAVAFELDVAVVVDPLRAGVVVERVEAGALVVGDVSDHGQAVRERREVIG